MHRQFIFIVIGMTILVGCAAGTPVAPETGNADLQTLQNDVPAYESPHRLWGEWTLYFNASHDKVEAVPKREARFHLNALKFLESYCTDCLKITGINSNGDGTIDLTVRIAHPFKGFPQYTGFDVKGIIMFQGSHEILNNWIPGPVYPPAPYYASWRLLGDPELMNADGYTYFWSPTYNSGSDMPIYNYWPGKYSKGTPTANINGFLNFYSNEDRHMFECDKVVTRTYRIWLPPGQPVVAGYAVDACWEPPIHTPVTDPAKDFPISANQPEAYHFHCVLNDGKPLTLDDFCCGPISLTEARAEMDFWYLVPETFPDAFWVAAWCPEILYTCMGATTCPQVTCDCGTPNDRCMATDTAMGKNPNGTYQFIALEWHVFQLDHSKPFPYVACDLFEFVIDQ